MKTVTHQLVQHAHYLAREIGARVVVIYEDAIAGDAELGQLLRTVNFPSILVWRTAGKLPAQPREAVTRITVPSIHMTRAGQVKVALLVSLAKGLLQAGDRVICLTGVDGSSTIDTLFVLDIGTESELFSTLDTAILEEDVNPEVFERTLNLAAQLAVEGREGRPVGTIFVLGDSDEVQAQSRNLVLNPFHGYPEAQCNILDPTLEETIKEFSAIDGAFVLRGDGVVLNAGVQLLPSAQASVLPKGLGTRHATAAAITASTHAVAIAISQSTGMVSVFKSGKMITDIHRPINGTKDSLPGLP